METRLPRDNFELKEAFRIIISIDSFSDYIVDIAELVYNGNLDKENLDKVLRDHKIGSVNDIKEELLDLLIVYINLILKDHLITDNERRNIELLKIYFKIKEGDFYKYRSDAIEDSLTRQFMLLYADNKIDKEEALYNVELQDLFDLYQC